MEDIEHTLFSCREVDVYKIPPRPAAGGHKSGEWKVADKLFTGRLRLTGKGDNCLIRLEDSNSGELFGECPIPPGQREVCVEPVADSSRYFVLRLLDVGSGRHAFVGLGFRDREPAFDLNVALSDHDKQLLRAKEVQAASSGAHVANPQTDAATLYASRDMSLKEGQTIKRVVNVLRSVYC